MNSISKYAFNLYELQKDSGTEANFEFCSGTKSCSIYDSHKGIDIKVPLDDIKVFFNHSYGENKNVAKIYLGEQHQDLELFTTEPQAKQVLQQIEISLGLRPELGAGGA